MPLVVPSGHATTRRFLLPLAGALTLTVATVRPIRAQDVAEKELGKPTAVVKDGFARAFSGIELTGGRVLFVDSDGSGTSNYMRVDFATGKVERMLGAGPEEQQFRSSGIPMYWTGDSIAFADAGKARLTILAPDGSYARSIKLGEPPAPFGGGGATAGGGGGRGGDATTDAPAAPRGPRIPSARYAAGPSVLFGVGFAPRPSGPPNPAVAPPRQLFPVVRYSLTNLAYDTVLQVLGAQGARPPQRSAETATMTVTIPTTPFQAVDTWVGFRDGFVAVVRAATYRVDLVAPDGTKAQGAPIPFPKIAVSDDDKKQYMNTFKKSTEEQMGRAAARSPIRTFLFSEPTAWPTVHPSFRPDHLPVLGSDDRIWLMVRCANSEKAVCYDAIDRMSTRVARYRLPAKTRLLAAGADAIYVVNESKGDNATLERYALR